MNELLKYKCTVTISYFLFIHDLVYGNTVTNSVYADAVCSSFKDGDFLPLKHSPSANVSTVKPVYSEHAI